MPRVSQVGPWAERVEEPPRRCSADSFLTMRQWDQPATGGAVREEGGVGCREPFVLPTR